MGLDNTLDILQWDYFLPYQLWQYTWHTAVGLFSSLPTLTVHLTYCSGTIFFPTNSDSKLDILQWDYFLPYQLWQYTWYTAVGQVSSLQTLTIPFIVQYLCCTTRFCIFPSFFRGSNLICSLCVLLHFNLLLKALHRKLTLTLTVMYFSPQ